MSPFRLSFRPLLLNGAGASAIHRHIQANILHHRRMGGYLAQRQRRAQSGDSCAWVVGLMVLLVTSRLLHRSAIKRDEVVEVSE